MWSGPRNISTALMRAWASRSDTTVIDEPFYAHYLQHTGYDHPGAAEVIATYETDWRRVIAGLLPGANAADDASAAGKIVYQKHMTQHMLAHIDRSWIGQVSNCFLIREPRRMLLSFARVIPNPRLEQLGLAQQVEIFHHVRRLTGNVPPVISSRGVLSDPEGSLRRLCARLELPFERAMLSWPAGPHKSDGLWAKHWYASVEKSTGFAPYQADDSPLPRHLRGLLAECQGLYEQMAAYCIN